MATLQATSFIVDTMNMAFDDEGQICRNTIQILDDLATAIHSWGGGLLAPVPSHRAAAFDDIDESGAVRRLETVVLRPENHELRPSHERGGWSFDDWWIIERAAEMNSFVITNDSFIDHLVARPRHLEHVFEENGYSFSRFWNWRLIRLERDASGFVVPKKHRNRFREHFGDGKSAEAVSDYLRMMAEREDWLRAWAERVATMLASGAEPSETDVFREAMSLFSGHILHDCMTDFSDIRAVTFAGRRARFPSRSKMKKEWSAIFSPIVFSILEGHARA